MGDAAATNVSIQIHTVDGQDLCRVHVDPAEFPVDAKVTIDVKGQFEKKTAFYVRIGNGTKALDDTEKQKYVQTRWPNA